MILSVMDYSNYLQDCLNALYVVFAFCSALFLGGLKAVTVGPIAGLILIIGNVGIILGLFPAHVYWAVYTLVKTDRFDEPLKVAILLALPALFGIWLGLSIVGSVLVGVGYGFFNPWVSAFEAFRYGGESKRFIHCIVDGTWDTVKGSCTVVRDFADICYSSYPQYLKELRESTASNELQPLRFVHVPGCIMIGVIGLIVVVPIYTAIAVVKSPYMLFKGWFRLIHDLLSREGPFLETACIPIAGLTILLWPIVVVGSIIVAVFSSFFIGLYGSVIVYQERSFWRGFAFVITMVAEFDEYTNDWLYLREGTLLPKPRYRKKMVSRSSEFSVDGKHGVGSRTGCGSAEAPAMLVPSLAHSRSVREAIQEVKMVQIWESMMRSCEISGKELLDTNVLTPVDLYEWLRSKDGNDSVIIGVGLPCYSLFQTLIYSIKVSSNGLLLLDGVEVTYFNRPKDKLLDWFFNPVMVLKEQIRSIKMGDDEVRFLDKVILFGSNTRRMEAWDNGSLLPQDPLRAAQIQGISRRMIGIVRSVSKLPTYRRRFRQVVKTIISYSVEKEVPHRSSSMRSVASIESV